ncbi:MAG: hypothetical protein EXQ88_04995 [Alphaproteobacteria bacterium]|nr:hypothetical protein [Alphaproteobacteria bacterium]
MLGRKIAAATVLLAAFSACALAAEEHDAFRQYGVWDLRLGMALAEIDADAFVDLACGTNGGPPSRALPRLEAFRACPPEASGWREVFLRYDDQVEYRARALDRPDAVERFSGTRVLAHPVILSILLDDQSRLAGIRFVSDPRAEDTKRLSAYLLGHQIMARFGPEDWACADTAPADGEQPLGGLFENRRCDKLTPAAALHIETRFFHRPGQTLLDPHTREPRGGQFESWARVEIIWAPAAGR